MGGWPATLSLATGCDVPTPPFPALAGGHPTPTRRSYVVDHLRAIAARSRPAWPIIWLLGLAATFLAPALQTGYWGEDLYQSIMPRGFVVLQGDGLGHTALAHVKHTMLDGRFFPLTPALITTVHYFFHDVRAYKAYIVAASILDIFLFYLLVARLSGRRDYACFAACVTIGLIQYRVAIDPSLGFFGQMQILIAGLFLSLLALQRSLEGRGRGWLAMSVALYFACGLLYEVSYVLVLLPICLTFRAVPGRRRGFLTSLPFLGVVSFCGSQTALVRWLHPSQSYWHKPSFDPSAVATALAHQVSAGLPLSYFLADPLGLFPGQAHGALLRWLLDGRAALVALAAFGLACLCLRGRNAAREADPVAVGWGWLACLGLILAVVPAVMISISPYHRSNISPGVGWIPALIQYYGVGLLLSAGLWIGVRSTFGGGPGASWKCVAAALLVAATVGITDRANREVVHCFNASPGSKRYRDLVARAGGTWHDQRRLLEAALDAGLLEEVPEHSAIQTTHEYPFWYDATYSRFFYAAYAGKAFDSVSTSTGPGPEGARAYRVRDILVAPDAGHVTLSRMAPGASTANGLPPADGLRLFVRHPELLRPGAGGAFRVASGGPSDAGKAFELDGRELPMIRSGRAWAIYSLEHLDRSFAPESLRVVFDPARSAPTARQTAAGAAPSGDPLRR